MGLGTNTATVDAAEDAASRGLRKFTGLLRAGVDPQARVSREWTVRDVAAHVAGFLPIYVRMTRGEASPITQFEDLPEWNRRFLAVPQHNVYALADTIDRHMDELLDAVKSVDGDTTILWHAGLRLPFSTVLGLLAGEGYVHGYDVARTRRVRWAIPQEDAVTILLAGLPLFPHLVDPERAQDMDGTVDVRLRGVADGRWSFRFARGELHVEQPDGRPADWTLSTTPAGYLLAAYGRLSPLKAIATGQVLGWGRRPALGMRFGQAFRSF